MARGDTVSVERRGPYEVAADGELYNRRGERIVETGGVLYGADEVVAAWVKKRLFEAAGETIEINQHTRALGVVRGGELIAGVTYGGWGTYGVECAIAASRPDWANREVLNRLYSYAFDRVPRITIRIRRMNMNSVIACLKMGFTMEALLTRGDHETGDDLMIMRMFDFECPWIRQDQSASSISDRDADADWSDILEDFEDG